MQATRALVLVPMVSIVVTAAYYVYTMQRILFGEPPKDFEHVHDLMPWERFSYVVLVILIFAVGLAPFLFLTFIQTYTSQSLPWLLGVL